MISSMFYQCFAFYLIVMVSLDSSCDYNECSVKYKRDCEHALQNGNKQEFNNAKSNYKHCLFNIEHNCAPLPDADVTAIADLLSDVPSCNELQHDMTTTTTTTMKPTTTTLNPAVTNRVKNILGQSSCIVRGHECSRKKRSVSHHFEGDNVTQTYPNWRDAVNRYSDCLCDAWKRKDSCILEIPVFPGVGFTSNNDYTVHQIVIFWEMEIKHLQCLVLSSAELECHLQRRTRVYPTPEGAVWSYMNKKELLSRASDGCGKMCAYYRCVFDAVNKNADPVEDIFYQCLFNKCRNKDEEEKMFPLSSTVSTNNNTLTSMVTRWTRRPTIGQSGTTSPRGDHRPTRQPNTTGSRGRGTGATSDMGNRGTTDLSFPTSLDSTTSISDVYGVGNPEKRTDAAAVVGILCGVVVVVVAVVLMAVWFWRRHRKHSNSETKPRYETTQACRQNSHTYMEISSPTYVNGVSAQSCSSVYYERAGPVPDILSGTESRTTTDDSDIYQVLDDYCLAGSVSTQTYSNADEHTPTTAPKLPRTGSGRRRGTDKSNGGQKRVYLELVPPESSHQSHSTEPVYDTACDIYTSKTEPDVDYYNIE